MSLIAKMKSLLPTDYDVVVDASINGKNLRAIAPHFWETPALPSTAPEFSFSLTGPSNPIPKSITINFGKTNCSYTVSGTDELWVAGAFEEIGEALRSKQSVVRRLYENYALTINFLSFLIALIALPSLDVPSRAALLLAWFLLAVIYLLIHRTTTTTLLYLKAESKDRKSFIDYPRILTTVVGAGVIGAITAAWGVLSGDTIMNLLQALITAQK